MVSNAAKVLMTPFGSEVEKFSLDVYYDIEMSPKQKKIFSQYQSLISFPRAWSDQAFSLFVTNRLKELLDALVVHCYHVLEPSEEHKYR